MVDTLPHTIKQKKLMRAIPESKSLREAAIKAGYTEKSVNIYKKATKRHIRESLKAMGYDEGSIKLEFERLSNLAESKNDFSNAMRGKENIARIMGLFKDKTELTTKSSVDSTQTSEDMLKEIRSRLAGKLDTLNITKPQE